jgi:hypothetical protein
MALGTTSIKYLHFVAFVGCGLKNATMFCRWNEGRNEGRNEKLYAVGLCWKRKPLELWEVL